MRTGGLIPEIMRSKPEAIRLIFSAKPTAAELRKLDVAEDAAVRVAANTCRWWRNSAMFVHVGLDTRYFDRLGVPRLAP